MQESAQIKIKCKKHVQVRIIELSLGKASVILVKYGARSCHASCGAFAPTTPDTAGLMAVRTFGKARRSTLGHVMGVPRTICSPQSI